MTRTHLQLARAGLWLWFFLLTVPAVATAAADQHRYTYHEGVSFGDPELHEWKSPWLDSFLGQRVRAELEWSLGASYNLDVPTEITVSYDQSRVKPGGRFDLAVSMRTYQPPCDDPRYVLRGPGQVAGLRFQSWFCRPKSLFDWQCRWHTVSNPVFDSLVNIEECSVPPLGQYTATFTDGITIPTFLFEEIPWFSEFVFAWNLLLSNQMKDRRITGIASVTPPEDVSLLSSNLKWDQNAQTLLIPIVLSSDFCQQEMTLSLDTKYRYRDFRVSYGSEVVFFHGTPIEIRLGWHDNLLSVLLDMAGFDDYRWFDNNFPWLGNANQHAFDVTIAVPQKHDLVATGLAMGWTEVSLQNYGTVELPCLRVDIKNDGCSSGSTSGYYVKFVGVNHGQIIDEVFANGLGQGESESVESGPITRWDKEFRVYVDSQDDVNEEDETNNIRQKSLTQTQDGWIFVPPDMDEMKIRYPDDYDPVTDGPILTPYPGSDDVVIVLPVIDLDDIPDTDEVAIDWSYFYDILEFIVKPPGADEFAVTDPGITIIDIPDHGGVQLVYDFNDGVEVVEDYINVNIDDDTPSPPQYVITVPVPDNPPVAVDHWANSFNVNVASTAATEDDVVAVAANVHSTDGAIVWDQHLQSPAGDNSFDFTGLSLLPGSNIIEVTAYDAAGNRTSSTREVQFNQLFVPNDETPPTVRFVEPTDGSYLNDTTPQISVQLTDARMDAQLGLLPGSGVDLESVRLQIDDDVDLVYGPEDGLRLDPSGLVSFEIPVGNELGFGQHTVDVSVEDLNGNESEQSVQIFIDTVPPGVVALGARPPVFEPKHGAVQRLVIDPPLTGRRHISVSTTNHRLEGILEQVLPSDPAFRAEYMAPLSGPNGANGLAVYRELTTQCDSPDDILRRLLVTVENAEPSAYYAVRLEHLSSTVDLVTDPDGAGAAVAETVFEDCSYHGTVLNYTLDEEAAVTVSVFAAAPGSDFEEEDYRITVHRDLWENGERVYSDIGLHQDAFDGTVPRLEVGEDDPVPKWVELDEGQYTYVVTAVDRAGNESTAEGIFVVHHPARTISRAMSTFELATGQVTGCEFDRATVTLRDALGLAIDNRLVAIRPTSDANDFVQVPPLIRDVFYTGAARQEDGRVAILPSTSEGKIHLPIHRLAVGTSNIHCDVMRLGGDGNPIFGRLLGSPAQLTANSICAYEVSIENSTVSVVEPTKACRPFPLEVVLRDADNQYIEDATVGLKFASNRTSDHPDYHRYDYFFGLETPQDGVVPVHTGSAAIEGSDMPGSAVIPVYATKDGSATYTVWLETSSGLMELDSVEVNIESTCTEFPSPELTTMAVLPPDEPGQKAKVVITLLDSQGSPVVDTTYAFQLISERNDPFSRMPELSDFFELEDMTIYDSQGILVRTTDEFGVIEVPINSLKPGVTEIDMRIVSAIGDLDIEGGVAATLTIEEVDADLIDSHDITIQPDPNLDDLLHQATIEIELFDDAPSPLANALLGIEVRSSRNHLEILPNPTDYFFDPAGPQGHVAPVMTDGDGRFTITVSSLVPGTAEIEVLIPTSSGPHALGPFTVSFDDDDADGVPNGEDACEGYDDREDLDNDGIPDGCDPPQGA